MSPSVMHLSCHSLRLAGHSLPLRHLVQELPADKSAACDCASKNLAKSGSKWCMTIHDQKVDSLKHFVHSPPHPLLHLHPVHLWKARREKNKYIYICKYIYIYVNIYIYVYVYSVYIYKMYIAMFLEELPLNRIMVATPFYFGSFLKVSIFKQVTLKLVTLLLHLQHHTLTSLVVCDHFLSHPCTAAWLQQASPSSPSLGPKISWD